MNMKERETILNDLLEKRGCVFAVQYCKVWKNNHYREGYRLFNFSTPVTPTIYEDDWFYKSDDKVVEYLINEYEKAISVDIMSKLPEFTYEYISTHILPGVVSETNLSMLQNEGICYRRIENTDLLAIFYIRIECQDEIMSCKMKNGQLENIGMDLTEAYRLSIQNQSENIIIQELNDIIIDAMMVDIEEQGDIDDETYDLIEKNVREFIEVVQVPMYVVSTQNKCNGASAILCDEARQEVREKLGVSEFIIIPSSIHECIVVPNYGKMEGIKELVHSVNCNLDIEDKLSDSLYICRNDKIEML